MNTHKSSDALNPTAPPVEFVIPQPLAIPQPSVPAAVSVQPHRSPPSMPVGKAEWSNDLCDCFEDCSEFCCACFCTPCYQYDIFRRANENFCSCIFGGLVPLRTKIRTERNIKVKWFTYFKLVYFFFLQYLNNLGVNML